MKEYIMPKMEIVEMDCEEVIASSSTTMDVGKGGVVDAEGKFRNGIFDTNDSDEGFNLF